MAVRQVNKFDIECEECHKVFSVSCLKNGKNRRRFCSKSCSVKNTKKGKEPWNKQEPVSLLCTNCGKKYSMRKGKIRKNRKFCSKKCYTIFMQGRKRGPRTIHKIINCKICGKDFSVFPAGENRIYCCKECYRKDIGTVISRNWKNPEYAKKVLHRRNKSSPEISFENLLVENNFPYYFNGYLNNKNPLMIGNKVPDFVHNSENKLIEIWGEYFHKGQNPQDRIDFFKAYGYDCMVVWAGEIKREDILDRIDSFTAGGTYA